MKTFKVTMLFSALLVLGSCSRLSTDIQVINKEYNQQIKQIDPWLLEEIQAVEGSEGRGMATASFSGNQEETRTHTELSTDGQYATVVWNPGDQFYMYAYNSTSGYFNYSIYTTTNGGNVAEFSHQYAIPSECDACYSIYPEIRKAGNYQTTTIFGVTVPITQTATAGSVSPGAAISLCKTDTQVENLHFHNATAFVKFKLSGRVVNSLQSVSLKGVTALAGNCVLMAEADGTPTLTTQIYFNDDVTSRSVTLTGSFQTGVDYYFAVFPGNQSGFSMQFSDGEKTKTMVSSKNLPLTRSVISDLGTINIGDSLDDGGEQSNAILYIPCKSGKTPVSIAVVSEGFTTSQLSDFELLAKSGIDAMFSVEPFKSYKDYFNVWILKVPSNESGASVTDGEGNIITPKDTYFSARWGVESYNDMTADLDKVLAFVEDNCPDVINGIHTASEVPVLMIINDSRYGGICHNYKNGRCLGMVPYVYDGEEIKWEYPDYEAASESSMASGTRAVTNAEKQAIGINRGDWRNIMIHEFGGHGFSRMLDEYWYTSYKSAVSVIDEHSWPVPYGLNISATYNDPLWQTALLDNKTTLESINPLYSRIGVYHGGDVSIYNRWRSEKISCMIDNRKYFSTWQRILIVNRIFTIAGETFDLNTFISKDDPTDPVRDVVSGATKGSIKDIIPPKVMPMLPPPVFHD